MKADGRADTVADGETARSGATTHGGNGGAAAEPENLSLSLWLRLIKTHNLVLRQVRRRLDPDLTLPQWDVLAQLAREPDGATPAGLSRRLIVTAGNLTGIIERLARRGLLRRDGDPADGRKIRLRLTDAGRARVRKMQPRHARDLDEILADVAPVDRVALRNLLGRVNEVLEGSDPRDRKGSSTRGGSSGRSQSQGEPRSKSVRTGSGRGGERRAARRQAAE